MVSIEQDIKDVLNKLDQRFEKLEEKLDKRFEKLEEKVDNIQKDVIDLKIGQTKTDEKLEGLSKRLDSVEFTSRAIVIGLVVAILGGAAKLLGFAPPA